MITQIRETASSTKMLRLSPLALVFAAGMGLVQEAQASTAANAIVRNTVTVNYQNANGTAQAALTATADVTVNLVRVAPTINTPADQTVEVAVTAPYSYLVTARANGDATYNLTQSTPGVPTAPQLTGGQRTITLSTASIVLGGTTTVSSVTFPAGSTAAVAVTVPRDQTSDASINQIAAGDTVVINVGGTDYNFTVSAVTDTTGVGTASLSLAPVVAPAAPIVVPVATIIGEQQPVTLSVTGNDPLPGTAPQYYVDVITTATDSVNAAATVSDTTVTTVLGLNVAVTKWVSNRGAAGTDAPGAGAGAAHPSNPIAGINYFATATANPGDVLEYLVEVTNTGTGTAKQVLVSDPVPQFTTFQAGTLSVDSGAGFAATTDADDGDRAESDGASVYAFPGGKVGGVGGALGDGTPGNVAGNATVRVKFQTKIQ